MNRPEIQLIPQRGALPTGQVGRVHVLVRIVPPPPPERHNPRQALNLALVLDRSGSMAGGKLHLAREAACSLVAHLGPRDRVGVVAFDSEVSCVSESGPVTDIVGIQRAIRSVHTGGQTALHQGWVEGGIQVSRFLSPNTVNRVILLTDGQANVGETRPDVLAAHARELAARGVSTTTMGIGDDYDEVLLEGMSDGGDGNFYHIDSPAQFEEFFSLELHGLSNLYARRVSLGLEPAAGVRVAVLNRLDRASTGRLMLPNLISGVPVEVVLRLDVDGPAREGPVDLVDLRLAWDPKDQEGRQVLRRPLSLPAVPAARLAEYPEAPAVKELAVLLEVAGLKHEATNLMRSGQFESARTRLDKARTLAMEAPPTREMQLELEDLDYIQQYVDMGRYGSAQKAAYYQSSLRSKSRSSISSGRTTREPKR